MSFGFTHLHVHSEYSMLDGLSRIADMFDLVSQQGGTALAITDHGTLSSMWQARIHSERTGVKLIPGLEAYLAIESRFDRAKIEVPSDDSAAEGGEEEDVKGTRLKKRAYEHLTILAKNRAGWVNLVALQNESSKHTYGRAKLIDYELLEAHSEGLMVLTGCIGGPVFGPLSRAVTAELELASQCESAADIAAVVEAGALFVSTGQLAEKVAQASEYDADASQQAQAAADDAKARFGELIIRGADMQLAAELAVRAHDERARATTNLEKLIAAVGKDNVYVEVMEHGNPQEQRTLPHLRALADQYGLPLVATNDSHHTHKDDNVAHAAWLAVGSKSTLAKPKFTFHGGGYHIRSGEEMASLNDEAWWREACENTELVAARVDDHIVPDPQRRLPEFPVPEGCEHVNDFLKKLIQDGIERKLGGTLTSEYRERLNFELNTIVSMGFVSYFLIVWEMISWARSQGSLVGPGRGSAAGSLVAYLMDITDVDPIEYDLLFERFLEPGRAELPDIDVDFESRFKQQVIKHLMELWGEDCVVQIGSIGKPRIRGSWKKALSALGEKPSVSDRIAKTLPSDVTAEELIASRNTGEVLRKSETINTREFWQTAEKLTYIDQALELLQAFFTVASNASVHASGVIISSEPLIDMIPMRWVKPAKAEFYRWVAEWDYRDLEGFGLVKFDVLAIRNLDMAAVSMELVKRLGTDLTLVSIPHPDHDAQDARVRRSFDMLKAGRTAGVFQLESQAMTRLLEDVAPDTLDELSAVVALFRPGPLSAGMHTKFADRKHGREPISYDYLTGDATEQAWLGTVMGVTYGVFVYQEQVMALGRVVAGFDDVWRSKLRKAVSKKNDELMALVGAKFLEGAAQEFRDEATGKVYSPVFSQATAERIWEAMKGSASYLFNKSHSICYALVAYYTAYLKANYPGDYGAATLSVTGADKAEKRVAAMNALIGEGMRILPPDVNLSQERTLPVGERDVRIGLGEIKGFGAAADLIAERDANGPFTCLDTLLTRVETGDDSRSLASDQVEALIDSGALDQFGPRLGMHVIAKAGDLTELPVPQVEFSPVELGVRQSKRLLMSLDQEVRDQIQETLAGWVRPGGHQDFQQPVAHPVGQLESMELADGSLVYVSGILASYSEKAYSKGIMGRIELEDASGSLQGVIWEEQRAKAKAAGDIPPVGFPVVLCGRLETRTFTVRVSPDDEDNGSIDTDTDGDEAETEITRRQISVQSMYAIDVDLTPVGYMPASVLPEIDLVTPVDGQLVAAPRPAAAKQTAADSVSVDPPVNASPDQLAAPTSVPVLMAVPALAGHSEPHAGNTATLPQLLLEQVAVKVVPDFITSEIPEVQHIPVQLTAVPPLPEASPSFTESEPTPANESPLSREAMILAALGGASLPVLG